LEVGGKDVGVVSEVKVGGKDVGVVSEVKVDMEL
jgi:hypothetical protein